MLQPFFFSTLLTIRRQIGDNSVRVTHSSILSTAGEALAALH